MDNILVRQMEHTDIEQVVKIEEEAFSSPWSAKSFEESLELAYSSFYVALIDNEIAGYIGTYLICDDIDITNIAVKESFRRQGIANKLIESVLAYANEKHAKYINLEVRTSNIPARSLYKKYGFEEIGVRKNFYNKPVEDGIIMQREVC